MCEYDNRDPPIIFAYDMKQLTAEELAKKWGMTLENAKIIKSVYEEHIKPREKQ